MPKFRDFTIVDVAKWLGLVAAGCIILYLLGHKISPYTILLLGTATAVGLYVGTWISKVRPDNGSE